MSLKSCLLGVALAVFVSLLGLLVLIYGALGIGQGHTSIISAVVMAGSLAAILIASRPSRIALCAEDFLFAVFVGCIVLSFAFNGRGAAPAKEIALLAYSLAAYLACRYVAPADLGRAMPAMVAALAIIVAAGTMATAVALAAQWNDNHGHPVIFGYEGSGIYYLTALGFLILAMVARGLTPRATLAISAATFVCSAVFSASLVRFTFIALLGCLIAAMIRPGQRKLIATIVAALVLGFGAGQLARHQKAAVFAAYAVEVTPALVAAVAPVASPAPVIPAVAPPVAAPSCGLDINRYNSIAIRKALLLDAVYALRSAGPAGLGLDGFMRLSCLSDTEVHNSILQAAIEFGWPAGIILAVLIAVALWRAARVRPDFPLYALLFVAATSMSHGRISRDVMLFGCLGLAAAVSSRQRVSMAATAPAIPLIRLA